jgi:LysM repeat protein
MKLKIIYWVLLMTVCLNSAFSQMEKTDKRIVKDTLLFYVHEVDKGQTLYGLSKFYQVSIEDIVAHNPRAEHGIKIGEQLYIPASKQKVEIHIVQKGETLYTIARKKGVPESNVRMLNPSLTENLSIGQEIIVPWGASPVVEEEEVTALISPSQEAAIAFARKQRKIGKDTVVKQQETGRMVKADSVFHIVAKGETLYAIAQKHKTTVDALMKINPNLSTTLSVSQRICISTTTPPPPIGVVAPKNGDTPPSVSFVKEGVRKTEYTVFVLLPLYLSQVKTIDPSKIKSLANYSTIKSFEFIQFYEAMLLAADDISAKHPSVKINLYVEDITSPEQIIDLVKTGKLDNADLIIGPFHAKEFAALCQYARNKEVLLVNTFSTIIQSYGSLIYKATSSGIYQGASFANYLLGKYPTANIIFANYQSALENKQIADYRSGMQNVFSQANKTVDMQEVNMKNNGIANIKSAISNTKENFLFAFFEGEITVTSFTQSLNAAKIENLTLVVPEQWLEHDNIETEYFMNLKTHYISQYFVDYSNPKVIRFIDAFRNAYDIEPTLKLYAFQGYDFTYYFLDKLCERGTEFQKFDKNENLLSTQFQFVPSTNTNMLENCFVHIFKIKNYRYIDAYTDTNDVDTKTSKPKR